MESNINIAYIDLSNHIIYIYSSNFLERNSIAPKGLTKLVNFNQKEVELGNEYMTDIFYKTCSDAYNVFECLKRWNKPALTKLKLRLSSNILNNILLAPNDFENKGDTLALLISESLSNLMQNAPNLEHVHISGNTMQFLGFKYKCCYPHIPNIYIICYI